ncbi:hypothetical protein DSO57_1006629 [Entomophthora muscae]|uniref:Uncharacterized protein n=1 Tax=Entomophthora muscae TaxID=34485 RepID=A0ACC2T7K9_9FUNG|nr:hypothetical protein DSO57_1006629 [Entomophthora muscae]
MSLMNIPLNISALGATGIKDFFVFFDDPDANPNLKFAICKFCNPDSQSLDCQAGKLRINKGSTSSCKSHLESKHKDQYLEFRHFIRRPADRIPRLTTTEISNKNALVNQVMIWLIHSGNPFTAVDDPYLYNILENFYQRLPGVNCFPKFPRSDYFQSLFKRTYPGLQEEDVREFNKAQQVTFTPPAESQDQ